MDKRSEQLFDEGGEECLCSAFRTSVKVGQDG